MKYSICKLEKRIFKKHSEKILQLANEVPKSVWNKKKLKAVISTKKSMHLVAL